jgi:NADH-quinone oxidoreductase subunit D
MRITVELETDGVTLNLGPQHPATHGTLRIIVKLDGEQVVAAYPMPGYTHWVTRSSSRSAPTPRSTR